MDKTTRYLILLFICIVFFALAPVIVIYVSGKSFNLTDSVNGTGILDVQTNPSDAQVYLNDKKSDSTPATIRFIHQGTYDISIKKDGYRNWTKTLFIESGKVTYAGTLDEAIILLPNSDPQLLSDKEVTTAVTVNNRVIFIDSSKKVFTFDLIKQTITNQAQLTKTLTKLEQTQHDNILLASDAEGKLFLLDTRTLKLTDLPSQLSGNQNLELVSENIILALKNNSLWSYDTNTKQAPKIILKDIFSFTNAGNLIYVAKAGPQGLETYYWDGKNLTKQNVLYEGKINLGQINKLYLTKYKELFLLADRSLFRINAQPELISNQVEVVNFNAYRQELTFATPTEIYFYNFISSRAELFFRSAQAINEAIVVPELGYGFIATNQTVSAVEIDNRNGQNQYSLFNSAPASIMQLSGNENQLVILADRKLYSIIVAD